MRRREEGVSKKEVVVCDGCGKQVMTGSSGVKDRYKFFLATDRFFVVDGWERLKVELDFCALCAWDLKRTLEKLVKVMEEKRKGGE